MSLIHRRKLFVDSEVQGAAVPRFLVLGHLRRPDGQHAGLLASPHRPIRVAT